MIVIYNPLPDEYRDSVPGAGLVGEYPERLLPYQLKRIGRRGLTEARTAIISVPVRAWNPPGVGRMSGTTPMPDSGTGPGNGAERI